MKQEDIDDLIAQVLPLTEEALRTILTESTNKDELTIAQNTIGALTHRCKNLEETNQILRDATLVGRPDQRQVWAIYETFILTQLQGEEVDAMQVKHALAQKWGLHADWHPAASVLEHLETKGRITKSTRRPIDGHPAYRITPKP